MITDKPKIHRGIIRGIERQNNLLTLVKLETIYDEQLEETIPCYTYLEGPYIGCAVDIITSTRDDLVVQSIVGSDFNISYFCGRIVACRVLSDYVNERRSR